MTGVKSRLGLLMWLSITFSAAWVGSRYMPGDWYAALAKPAWNPPNWIFGPVWSLLYVLMAVAAWLVWRKAGFSGAGMALFLFLVQLGLNALWSYLFFGQHRPDQAFMDIGALWVVILATTFLFWHVHRPAGVLMMPYLLWVSFAAVLNLALWRMNPTTGG